MAGGRDALAHGGAGVQRDVVLGGAPAADDRDPHGVGSGVGVSLGRRASAPGSAAARTCRRRSSRASPCAAARRPRGPGRSRCRPGRACPRSPPVPAPRSPHRCSACARVVALPGRPRRAPPPPAAPWPPRASPCCPCRPARRSPGSWRSTVPGLLVLGLLLADVGPQAGVLERAARVVLARRRRRRARSPARGPRRRRARRSGPSRAGCSRPAGWRSRGPSSTRVGGLAPHVGLEAGLLHRLLGVGLLVADHARARSPGPARWRR